MNFKKATRAHVFKDKRGFSLIELLVTLVIMSVVSLAIYSVISVSSRTYTTQGVTADVQQSVRAAMEVMLQDIRAAGLDPTASGNFGIELCLYPFYLIKPIARLSMRGINLQKNAILTNSAGHQRMK